VDVGTPSRSRDMICPSDASIITLLIKEGAGNTGCWPHPRALRAKKSALCARKKPQGSRTTGVPCAMGLRLIRGLLGAPGFLATVASRIARKA